MASVGKYIFAKGAYYSAPSNIRIAHVSLENS